jgi:hypothetical protein
MMSSASAIGSLKQSEACLSGHRKARRSSRRDLSNNMLANATTRRAEIKELIKGSVRASERSEYGSDVLLSIRCAEGCAMTHGHRS